MGHAHPVGDHHHQELSTDTFKSATASSAVFQLAGAVMDSAQQDAVCLAGSLEDVFYLCIWVNSNRMKIGTHINVTLLCGYGAPHH